MARLHPGVLSYEKYCSQPYTVKDETGAVARSLPPLEVETIHYLVTTQKLNDEIFQAYQNFGGFDSPEFVEIAGKRWVPNGWTRRPEGTLWSLSAYEAFQSGAR